MYILSIILYGFLLWYYNKALLSYPFKVFKHMQRRAAVWILKVFWTSPSISIEAIASLDLINLHFWKLGGRLQLCTQLFLLNHIIISLLESNYSLHLENHHLSLETLTVKQYLKVKSSIMDVNNKLNRVFNSFDPFNNKLSPKNRLIDLYSSCFSFHYLNRKSSNIRKTHLCHLDEIVFNILSDSKTAIVISDTSIKN